MIIALNQTLTLHEKIRAEPSAAYSTKDLIYHYNCGELSKVLSIPSVIQLNNSSLNKFEIAESRKFDEYLREELLYNRNKKMARRVMQHIVNKPNQSFLFAFGAGKYFGVYIFITVL